MAEVEKRAVALLGLVPLDDAGLHLDRAADRVLAQRHIARSQRRAVALKPGEKGGIPQQPVFHHLAIAREEIAGRQRAKDADVGQHQRGLVEGADQVLAMGGVDAGLAANGTVDLRQKRGRDLHEAHAPAQDGGGKARKIADHAAAEGNHHVAAFDLFRQQPVDGAGKLIPALRRLARGQGQRRHRDIAKASAERVKVERAHGLIRQNRDAGTLQKRRDRLPRALDQPGADAHVIAARAQIDMDRLTHPRHRHFIPTSPCSCNASITLAAICSTV